MKKYILSAIAGALTMLIIITITAAIRGDEEQASEEYEHIDYASAITQEECYVCGDAKDFSGFLYWGEEKEAQV